uniref:Uncharacterized protein n=1 Tax=Rhizophagus irregularis (strain DAOM 181602 / DAOM 197198 / MUCL 43194) TaxID=747089 RepID=U9TGM6_RHIID
MNPIVCPLIPGYLQENGFVDIDTLKNSGHYGSSAGRFGKLALEDFILVFDALKTPISSILEINNEEYQNLLDKLQEEVDTNDTFYEVYNDELHPPPITANEFDGSIYPGTNQRFKPVNYQDNEYQDFGLLGL